MFWNTYELEKHYEMMSNELDREWALLQREKQTKRGTEVQETHRRDYRSGDKLQLGKGCAAFGCECAGEA